MNKTSKAPKLSATDNKTLAKLVEVGSIADFHHRVAGMNINSLCKLEDMGLIVRTDAGVVVA